MNLPPVSPQLGSVALSRLATDRSVVTHETVQPVLDVQCSVEGRDLGAVAGKMEQAIEDLGALPTGVSVRLTGQSQTMFRAFGRLALGMLVAVALVYLILVVLYQSWLDPFLIMLAIPGAFSGILWMLFLTKTSLNVESFMGSIMAVGIAASNSILLVNFANEARAEQGVDPAGGGAHLRSNETSARAHDRVGHDSRDAPHGARSRRRRRAERSARARGHRWALGGYRFDALRRALRLCDLRKKRTGEAPSRSEDRRRIRKGRASDREVST